LYEEDGKWIEHEVDETIVSIDMSNLDTSLCDMGKLLLQYGIIEAKLKNTVERIDSHLKHIEAQADTQIRHDYKEKGEKITETQIRSLIPQLEDYQTTLKSLHFAKLNHGVARWVTASLNAKKDCLVAVTYRDNALIKAHGG
jgi:ribosomal protein L30/L7E